jgi:hypothetical protein
MSTTAWRDGIQRAHQEGGGLFRVHCVGPENAIDLLAGCLAGDAAATGLMRAVVDTVARIESAPRRHPMLCGCCPRSLGGSKFTICVAVPERADPTRAVSFALCSDCGRNADTRTEKAMEALLRIWPDIRPIAIHPAGGRA